MKERYTQIDDFKNLNDSEKQFKEIANYYNNTVLSETNITTNFVNRLQLQIYIYYTERDYKDVEEYKEHRKQKFFYTQENIDFINGLMANSSLAEVLNNTANFEEKTLRGNAFFLLLSNMTMNSDSFQLDATKQFVSLIGYIVDNADTILSIYNKDDDISVAQTLLFYFTISLDYLINVFRFNEVDYTEIQDSIDPKTNFVNYEMFKNLAEKIEKFSRVVTMYDYSYISDMEIYNENDLLSLEDDNPFLITYWLSTKLYKFNFTL